MTQHGTADPRTDKALRIKLQYILTKPIVIKMNGGELEKDFERNQYHKKYINT